MLAIKQTLYRTSGDSPIVDALIDAAEAGKQVLAHRRDQGPVRRAGQHLLGPQARAGRRATSSTASSGLKTHAKLCLVVRQESDGLRRYCHIGTGNYNPKTARLYEDFGLLTCDPAGRRGPRRLFNQLSGYAPRTRYKRLLVAPRSLRSGLVDRIDAEIAHHEAGRPAPSG